jgi:plasmid replication initiation protein
VHSKDIVKVDENKIAVIKNDALEACYDMSANQLKLFIALVSLIEKDDTEFQEYKIDAKSLMTIFNISNIDDVYSISDKVTDGLIDKIIKIKDKQNKKYEKYPIFTRITYSDGVLVASFNEYMKPFLLNIKKEFTKFMPREFKPFSSKYSIRIYQLLKQYQFIGERSFKIIELREMLGIEINELKNFKDFRKYVLETAQRELQNTPMAFDWEAFKKGRGGKVVEVKLKLKNKHQSLDYKSDENIKITKEKENAEVKQDEIFQQSIFLENKEIFQQFKNLYKLIPPQYKTKALDNLIAKYTQEKGYLYVKQNIEYVLNQKNVKNFMLYLTKALEKDYGYATTSEIDARINQDNARIFFEATKDISFEYKNTIFRVVNCRYDPEKKEYILECRKVEDPEHGVILGAPSIEFLQKGIHWLGVINIENLL